MRFRPLHDRVVVRRIDAEEKTKGGIIIPDTAQEKPQDGELALLGARNPVLGDARRPQALRHHPVSGLAAQRPLHGIGEVVDAAQQLLTGIR